MKRQYPLCAARIAPMSKQHLLAAAVSCALVFPMTALAQSAGDAADLDAVIVTGIRGSLQSSMNLKRDSAGVVDGIIAEDIGKFPDTNLAESLQRISGVSIDRTSSGEGSRVTIRGVGPDFNLVLLNGRQMPASNLGVGGQGVSNSRAFDFANLASEAVSEMEVYKTSRANLATGGIGAVINIKTARPLNTPGFNASIGVKGVMDQSVDNLPRSYRGKSLTPEISGMFSNTFADGRFGIAANASYQERDSGYSQANVSGGWLTFRGDDDTHPRRIPRPGQTGYDNYTLTNPPGLDDVYGRPQNITMTVNGVQRQRRNGQVALQFRPVDNLTTTLDYTYADNRIQQQYNQLSVYFNMLPGISSWTNGPVAAPIIYSEPSNGLGNLAMNGGQIATRSELNSLGFNLEWQVRDNLDLAFDYHTSRAETGPDSLYGSSSQLGVSTLVRRVTTVDFSGDFPIFTVELGPGINQVDTSHAVLSGSWFSSSFNRSEVEQWQASGTFRFADYQALDFGIANTEVYNRTASADMQNNFWGGIGTPADYADDIWYVDNMGRYFKRFAGHNDPRFTDRFLVYDYDRLYQRALEMVGQPVNGPTDVAMYRVPDGFTRDLRTTEESSSVWLQWRNTFDAMIPIDVSAGVRYEKTKINSPSWVLPPASNVIWPSRNELHVELGTTPVIENFSGEYDYWLPSLDARAELRENMMLRASYSQSIGRAGWRDIQGGLSVSQNMLIGGGSGYLGNPGLLPLESKNFDLSFEWYYSDGSYASLGYFRKNIKNFISNTLYRDTPFPDVHTPVGGTYWNNAITLGNCLAADMVCIRNYIFTNHRDDPGVEYAGIDAAGRMDGIITGLSTDPIVGIDITTPLNQRSDKLDGWELSLQHMFGNSGFGVSANYTKVSSGLTFDNYSLGDQYPMVGLSDSANLVLFYEKYGWQIRAAYNWRDEFLSDVGSSATGPEPDYTESYGQLDVNITWTMNEQLSFFVEGINLTDETMRIHGRHKNMLRYASQTGARYMFGVRYKF